MLRNEPQRWHHPGGKLRELGPETLSDAELLSILIAPGIPGRPAESIAKEILQRFGGFKGMANQPLEHLADTKGIADVKTVSIAADFEMAHKVTSARSSTPSWANTSSTNSGMRLQDR